MPSVTGLHLWSLSETVDIGAGADVGLFGLGGEAHWIGLLGGPASTARIMPFSSPKLLAAPPAARSPPPLASLPRQAVPAPATLPPPTSPCEASIPGGAVALARGAAEIADVGISVRHLERLLGGLLLATSPRVDWAKQLLRIYTTDVLACASCGGRLRLLSAMTEKATVKKILEHLGLPAEPPERRARDPAAEDAGWADAPG